MNSAQRNTPEFSPFINLILCGPMTHVLDIKLIRIDTTLDLSQETTKSGSSTRATSTKKLEGIKHQPS
ncbi:hypothetical protein ACOSP7_022391 [Xanthoceras sorbifolium]